tara:strand:+ start:75 stop:533 length:459 start_codon:yes stop_codon:yes gene_type:complete
MIRTVSSKAVRPLRQKVLRPGKEYLTTIFPGDDEESSFHLAAYQEDVIVGCISFYSQDIEGWNSETPGFRFRGMAVEPSLQRQGLGKRLLLAGIQRTNELQGGYVWCNARSSARRFYEKFGMGVLGNEFEISEVGPHFLMVLHLKVSGPSEE